MKLFSCFVISLCVLAGGSRFGEWELKKSEDNIDIYTRSLSDSSLKEFKATTVFTNISMDAVLKQVLEAPYYYKDCDFGTSYFMNDLSSQAERYFYYSEKLPWPIQNRDVVTKLSIEEQTPERVLLSINAVPDLISSKNKTIRITDLKGFWLLEKHAAGIRATQQIYMDPGGTVPSFIVNSLIVKGPLKTFSSLKKTFQQ